MSNPLPEFIAETGDTITAFGARVAADEEAFRAILAGEGTRDLALARRIVAACAGACSLDDFYPAECAIADFTQVAPARDDLDTELLAGVIDFAAARLMAGLGPFGTGPASSCEDAHLAAVGADAAAAAYAALSPTSEGGPPSRLALALAPALEGMLAERKTTVPLEALHRLARFAALLYFEARRRL